MSRIAVSDCRGSLAVGGRYELQFPISKETQNQGSYIHDRATILRELPQPILTLLECQSIARFLCVFLCGTDNLNETEPISGTICEFETKAHQLGSRDGHPLTRLQRYYHTDENLETNSTRRANQTPRVNLDRRRSQRRPTG
ncbi:hypothetical protein PENNAL_c0589G10561, partial [Penicillium nalgiovense]